MTATKYRDQVAQLAKTDAIRAAEIAGKIRDPWFQAQAWSHLARYADDPLRFSRKAAKSASQAKDDFERSAVRAWEIAALAERGFHGHAHKSLTEAVELAVIATPDGSRAESLLLLFQAAFKISNGDAVTVAQALDRSCSSTHWRSKRARKDVEKMLSGEMPPREFFW
jgi:hypothetical protein